MAGRRSPKLMSFLPPGLGNRLTHVTTAKNGALLPGGQDGAPLLGKHLVERIQVWRERHGTVTFLKP
jgi:hypothetical protein